MMTLWGTKAGRNRSHPHSGGDDITNSLLDVFGDCLGRGGAMVRICKMAGTMTELAVYIIQ